MSWFSLAADAADAAHAPQTQPCSEALHVPEHVSASAARFLSACLCHYLRIVSRATYNLPALAAAVAVATAAADLNLYNEFLKLSNGQYAELFYPAGYSS
jgi:hypothetical protein